MLGAFLGAAMSRHGPAQPGAPARSAPLEHVPAVPDGAVRLLSIAADSDVVSPAGTGAVMCALVPVMSDAARRQLRAASESECGPAPDYVARSIWIERNEPLNAGAEALLRPLAEVHYESAPLSVPIDRWLDEHDALHVPIHEPIVFAAVSVLDYARAWALPFHARQARIFHGAKRDAQRAFLSGLQYADVQPGACVRGILPLDDGGYVFLTLIGDRSAGAAFHCLGRAMDMRKVVNARIALPPLALRRCESERDRLVELGLKDVFDARANPFPKLLAHRALRDVIQAAALDLDENGIRVRATTIADIPLGIPHARMKLVYDRPFAMRAVDGHGATVAVGIVNDVAHGEAVRTRT